jgi:DNA-binding transcriptional MerR regulator
VNASARYLSPAEAAARLGVSAKALRLYEQRGLLAPARTAAGWRAYGPKQMALAAEIVALRGLGLSLAQAARVLTGDPDGLEPTLAAHQAALEARGRDLAGTAAAVRRLRDGLRGETAAPALAFDLPWPWGGERFELAEIRPLTWIVGPLGSGKTRLAMRIAEALPGAVFVGLERGPLDDALAVEGASALVVDLVEQGLDEATQRALAARLRARGPHARPLFLMTRSSAMLELTAVTADETLLLCPANHSPPMVVEPMPGAAGYEALASCLAPPAVRARTEGLIAWRPDAA